MMAEYRHLPSHQLRAFVCTLALAAAATLLAPAPGVADWVKDAKEAAIKYADDKKDELVKDQAKAAILALYKKLYRSSADLALSRTLASVAISAPELNKLMNEVAEAYASGDPEKQREASEKVAVSFGQQLSRLASNSKTRQQLGAIIGSADKVKEISAVLGNVAAGTDEGRRAAAEYVGQALINLTPGAGIVSFYQSAYGAMKYANNEYVDSKIEDLYQSYKKGDAKTRELILDQLRAGTGGYGYVIENRRKELGEEKIAGISGAAKAASERVKEHLTKTTNEEVIRNIIASFDGRIDKERKDAAIAAEREKAQKEAEAILEKLNDVASQRHGSDWHKTRTYDLDKYTSSVRNAVKADGVLDPNNPAHLKAMSELLSTAMTYGRGSKEYKKLLGELRAIKDEVIATHKGAPCTDGSPTQALASRLWQKGRRLVAEKKIAAALPLLTQSLEFCPDEERAAQLAELTNLAEPTPQGIDGSYAGELTLTSHDLKTPRTETGSLKFTVKAGALTGTLISRQPDPHRADIVRRGDISGQVSSQGQIVARITGRSYLENLTTKGFWEGQREWGADIVATLAASYSFEGAFTGQLSEGQGSGKFSATRLGEKPRPNNLVGTWKAARN